MREGDGGFGFNHGDLTMGGFWIVYGSFWLRNEFWSRGVCFALLLLLSLFLGGEGGLCEIQKGVGGWEAGGGAR